MSFQEESVVRALMARIGNASSPAEAFSLYGSVASLLENCKFVFAAQSGGTPGFSVNRTFSAGASVRSLFKTEKVLVLDGETARDMLLGTAKYPIDFSISLDTQALSYLEPYIAGKSSARLPKDFIEVFEFIAREDVFVDPIPYILENLHNIKDPAAANRIFTKLKAYEVLRTLDLQHLQTHGSARSRLSPEDLERRAQEHMARMFMNRDDRAFMKALTLRHQVMYSQLLKMVLIQLRSPRGSISIKMEEFAEFTHSQLALMSGRETALARAYFERGQDLTFFGSIQKNSPNLFKTLNGMAWDLWHVRQMEEAMTFKPSRQARYFFPALLTFDKRLIEVIDLYPLKACAFKVGDSEPLPFYDGDWFDLVTTEPAEKMPFMHRFYSDRARAYRHVRRGEAKTQIGNLVTKMEDELGRVASVVYSRQPDQFE